MKGHVQRRGKTWRIVYELGSQRCQRCRDCRHRRWLSEGQVASCPRCGGPLDFRVERRQRFEGGYRTRREAQRALIEALSALHDGSHVSPSSLTLGDYLENEWLPSRHPKQGGAARSHRGQVSLGTWTSYRDIVDAYLVSRIGGVLLQDLAPSHLDGLYDDLESCCCFIL